MGPSTAAQVGPRSRQVVVVTGDGLDSASGMLRTFERTAGGPWEPVAIWPAHNGRAGWTRDHREGDLRSPVGVFSLSDAGGLLPDPGTRLPYDCSGRFDVRGTGLGGEDLAGTFDHVVAIDYNRVPGRSPLDRERPRGEEYGGGIWLHVDHGGGSRGCVTVPRAAMVGLLGWLDPALVPVVVMGDEASLSR